MVPYKFTRQIGTRTETGKITFESGPNVEVILIADDWIEGEALWKDNKPHSKTGFLGKGGTKRAIYVCSCSLRLLNLVTHRLIQARFNGEEYALVQSGKDGYMNVEVESVLRAEYELLLHGQFYKREFDDHAEQCGVQMPSTLISPNASLYCQMTLLRSRFLFQCRGCRVWNLPTSFAHGIQSAAIPFLSGYPAAPVWQCGWRRSREVHWQRQQRSPPCKQ
jgi:hypothetical protein